MNFIGLSAQTGNPLSSQGTTSSLHQMSLDIHNPLPLSQLNLTNIDAETRLILEEKEQALLASQETVGILNTKVKRLEHLLKLKDQRIDEQRKVIADLQERMRQLQ